MNAPESSENAQVRTSTAAGGGTDLRRAFVFAWLALVVLKVMLARDLALFGDEAFYWLESTALAWGYTDVPPITPWLVALGTHFAGTHELGVRWPFLVLGAAMPWLVVAWARRFVDERDAYAAGLLALCVPIASLLGLLALPDVPLTFAMLLGVIALERAVRLSFDGASSRRVHAPATWLAWTAFGAVLALGWLSHYRFVMFYVAGAVFLLLTTRGRATLLHAGFWLSQAVAALGLVPLWLFNRSTDYAALRFQFVERHPWAFHADAITEPVVQALVTTPVLFALCVFAMTRAWRMRSQGGAPFDVLAALSLGVLVGYLTLGFFADAERVKFHWPMPAYLIALPLVPAALRALWQARPRWLTRPVALIGPALGVVLVGAMTVLLVLGRQGASATTPAGLAKTLWLVDNTGGWQEVGHWAESLLEGSLRDVVIADNFMLGAELEFASRGTRAVYVLDHPANRKHGRAAQLALWGRDEAGLSDAAWRRGLLIVEEASRPPVERIAAYRALCDRFGSVRIADELRLRGGRAPFVAFEVRPKKSRGPCEVPAFAYVDSPLENEVVRGDTLTVRGWALAEFRGVRSVEVLIDGRSAAEARYGLPRPEVREFWPDSVDPSHPDVGFEATIPIADLAAGRHVLSLRVVDRRGRERVVAEQAFERMR